MQSALEQALARQGVRLIVGFVLGVLSALAQAPWGLWPLSFLGFAGLFALYRTTPDWLSAGLLGFVAGAGHFVLALSWIVEPFFIELDVHGWMSPFALKFMAEGAALFWALGFAGARRFGRGALVFVAAMGLVALLRGWLFTGFPWALPAHGLIGSPWMGLAAYGGASLLGVVVTGGGAALALLLKGAGRTRLLAAFALACIAGAGLWGAMTPAVDYRVEGRPVVRIIQPNAPQTQKWDRDYMPVFFNRQVNFTAAPRADGGRPDVVVWPETAVPVLLGQSQAVRARIAEAAQGAQVVLGIQRLSGPKIFNSLVVMNGAGAVQALYDKHHLVPFGEYLPFGNILKHYGLKGLAADDGNGYSAGPGPRLLPVEGVGWVMPLICYEGVFAREVRSLKRRADALLLVTNDAWFGQHSGPYQHLAQARLRAAEMGLPMIRAANTGVSAMIGPRGEIIDALPLGEAGFIDAALPAPLPETVYARFGDWPWLALFLIVLVLTPLGRNTARTLRGVANNRLT